MRKSQKFNTHAHKHTYMHACAHTCTHACTCTRHKHTHWQNLVSMWFRGWTIYRSVCRSHKQMTNNHKEQGTARETCHRPKQQTVRVGLRNITRKVVFYYLRCSALLKPHDMKLGFMCLSSVSVSNFYPIACPLGNYSFVRHFVSKL